jgi:hypothetical protein
MPIGRFLQAEHMPSPLSVAVIGVGVVAIGVFMLWLVSLVSMLAAEILGLVSSIVIILTLASLVVAIGAPDRSK